jgi:hypothetical protein
MKVHVIGSLIAGSEDLKAIHVHAQRIARLDRAYRAAVPKQLSRRSRVADERAGALLVIAESSAVAAKLRQLVPRIVSDIVKSAPEITAMRIEVQVGAAKPLPRPPRGVSVQGMASFSRLHDELPDSPLRDAVARLLEHSRRGSDRQDHSFEDEERDDDQG